jgi:APA family basic amino acid/polyamine antiporter
VLIKIVPIMAVVVIAAMLGVRGEPLQPIDVPAPSLGNIATASALCLFAVTGFEFAMSRWARSAIPSVIWFAL